MFNVFCLFGGINLTVPLWHGRRQPGDRRVRGSEVGKLAPPDRSAPRIVVKGFVGFGGVDIRNPKVRKERG